MAMTHFDTELQKLKSSLMEMWRLVIDQLEKSKEVLENYDKNLAQGVLSNEKRVDAYELKINMDCENILALFTPVANDLRFILAVMKITYNLERIGDYAKTIAKIVQESEKPFHRKDLKESQIGMMYKNAGGMISGTLEAFSKEDVLIARDIFKHDEKLDKVNRNANDIIEGLISKKPSNTGNYLNLLSIIHKLERVGDQAKNIAEEIIFYIEAQMIRHQRKKKKGGK